MCSKMVDICLKELKLLEFYYKILATFCKGFNLFLWLATYRDCHILDSTYKTMTAAYCFLPENLIICFSKRPTHFPPWLFYCWRYTFWKLSILSVFSYIQGPVAVFTLGGDKSCFFPFPRFSPAPTTRVLNGATVYLFRRAAFIFRVLCFGRWWVSPRQVDPGVYLKWGVRHARVLRSPADHVFSVRPDWQTRSWQATWRETGDKMAGRFSL